MSVLFGAALGGAIGAACRYIVSEWLKSAFQTFVWGTLVINVTGSFILGWFMGAQLSVSEWLTFFLATGFCGGFTTFSTFIVECLSYGWRKALSYILLTMILCPLFFMAGYVI